MGDAFLSYWHVWFDRIVGFYCIELSIDMCWTEISQIDMKQEISQIDIKREISQIDIKQEISQIDIKQESSDESCLHLYIVLNVSSDL